MASHEQALILEPAGELRFKGPFTDVVTADLKLSNPTDRRICFKVKTTAPKRYCVRPNSGILEPKTSIAVAVMLQPFNYDPNEKNKHKFMVQSMYAPDHVVESQELLWKDAPPESLMDTKLRCVFEMPDGSHQAPASDASRATDAGAHFSESALEDPTVASRKTETQSPKRVGAVGSAGEDVKKLQHELKKAQSEITSLKGENSQLKDEGIRLRKVAMTDTVSPTPLNPSPAPAAAVRAFPPVVYVVAAIILGLIIGKFLL
ncbi:vesicle-associated membrane protein/synaptobrevin-binding protein [Aplysia californica]|uniref:Vesicle-associated membrane protein/synaptobrevin-binding protein n=1 Tax=Aplysia californica TaxID=6500 RepID=VP33_APLCA|nr:vesicle-associated membrane protein/synaptobrevin-binding protein [Aplysia californica]Q16943.1 RecName: Full=Vesicle-associated membrane protein/synaptobrevin-binding protein; AltName: Full=VAP-33 [Aplysia californica]AAC46883.1 vesicle-associated membrane protein/synaptobrevin binding protein [Aplysia californica]